MMDTNLHVMTPSRRKPKAGDVFALQPMDERFLFGRVITTEASIGPMEGCVLVYLFRTESAVKVVPARVELRADRLLVPPIMTNRLPWSRGLFETVAELAFEPGEVLGQHCFRRSNGQYFDEANHELPGPIGHVGDWGLHSFRTIDDLVSDALGIPRVAD